MTNTTNPNHYNKWSIQPIDIIEEWELNFSLGNVIKYIARHRDKGTPITDIQKALWYLERELKRLQLDTIEED